MLFESVHHYYLGINVFSILKSVTIPSHLLLQSREFLRIAPVLSIYKKRFLPTREEQLGRVSISSPPQP